jgi:hypothetical protein
VAEYVRRTRTALPGEINYHPFDRWTIGHLGVGVWFGLLRAPWWATLAAAIAWEIVERPLKDRLFTPMVGSTQDTTVNAVFDVIAWMAGYGAMMMLPPPKRVAP